MCVSLTFGNLCIFFSLGFEGGMWDLIVLFLVNVFRFTLLIFEVYSSTIK